MTVNPQVDNLQDNFNTAENQLTAANNAYAQAEDQVQGLMGQINGFMDEGDTQAAFILIYALMAAVMNCQGDDLNVYSAQSNVISSLGSMTNAIQTTNTQATEDATSLYAAYPDPGDEQNGELPEMEASPEGQALGNDAATMNALLQNMTTDLEQTSSWMDPSSLSQFQDSLSSITNVFSNDTSSDSSDLSTNTTGSVYYDSFSNPMTPSASQTLVSNNITSMQTVGSSTAKQTTMEINFIAQQYSQMLSMNQDFMKEHNTLVNSQINNEKVS